MVSEMCGAQLNDQKRSTDLMFMLGLNETMDQLALASSVRWYGHVLMRQDGHILRRALDFEVVGQRKKGRPNRTWKKLVEEESVKVGLRREDALCRSKWNVGMVEVNLATLTCLRCCQILSIDVFLSLGVRFLMMLQVL